MRHPPAPAAAGTLLSPLLRASSPAWGGTLQIWERSLRAPGVAADCQERSCDPFAPRRRP